jgi:hypothetical protein
MAKDMGKDIGKDIGKDLGNDTDKSKDMKKTHITATDAVAYLNANNMMERQIVIASVTTEQMLDWLVLGNIVSRKWKTFSVFGVELTDTTLISRLIGIIVSILVTTQIGQLFQWWS